MHTVDPEKMIHPLRDTLSQEDWTRIQTAMENEDVEVL